MDIQDLITALADELAKLSPAGQRAELQTLCAAIDRRQADPASFEAMLLELSTDLRQRVAVGRWPGTSAPWGIALDRTRAQDRKKE